MEDFIEEIGFDIAQGFMLGMGFYFIALVPWIVKRVFVSVATGSMPNRD